MFYGILPNSLRTHEWEVIEDTSADVLIKKGCMGVFVNKSDAEWVLDILRNELE